MTDSLEILLNKYFSLPFLGKETFMDLMKARVEHNKKYGFRITSSTNIPRALSILSSVLNEPVEMARSCFICDNPIEIESTSGFTESQAERTLCSDCTRNDEAYDLYVMKFAKLMETV